MIKWIDGFVVALSVTAVMLIFTVLSVSAHAYLAESMPMNGSLLSESPEIVSGQFSQEIESRGSWMRVLDENGRFVDNGDSKLDLYDPNHKTMTVTVPNELPDGQYTVEWVVISAEDGDPTNGAFSFGIGTDLVVSDNNNSNELDVFTTSSDSVGWWVGGGIATLVVGLFIAMLFLTRQPKITLE